MERTEIDAVRRVPLADFLARLRRKLVRGSGNELWYLTSYRDEHTPSFHVNMARQFWHDFGSSKGDDILALTEGFLQSDGSRTRAKFTAEVANTTVTGWEEPTYLPKPIEPVSEDVEVASLFRSPLTEYLAERGIPYAIASRHRCRPNHGVRGKRYSIVDSLNMAGGYEVKNRYFKGCTPPEDMSLVMVKEILASECLVLEGLVDLLSMVTLGATGSADCLVLNSVTNVEKAAGLPDGYGCIDRFFDRDEAGWRTFAALVGRYGERVTDHSSLYDDCEGLNKYLQLATKN